MSTPLPELKHILEVALFTAGRPLNIDDFFALFPEEARPERHDIRQALKTLQADYAERNLELIQVASGYRLQAKAVFSPWLKRLFTRRSPRYSRALLETLALIAYRQPITRSEIEAIRGVTVSSAIIRTLQDYHWIRVLAYRDTAGKPALYGTTRAFLDHFGLKNLDGLPTLAELRDMQNLDTVILDFIDEQPDELTDENPDITQFIDK